MTARMKRIAGRVAGAGAIACATAVALAWLGALPFWVSAAITVLAFPVTVLALFLWWMADEKEGDIPFIGY